MAWVIISASPRRRVPTPSFPDDDDASASDYVRLKARVLARTRLLRAVPVLFFLPIAFSLSVIMEL